jgi:hypothetical protein
MKPKLSLFVAFISLGLMLFFTKSGYAEYRMETCDVVQAGIEETGAALFKFKPLGETKSKGFVAPVGREKEMLAIALTAMSSGMKVKALIDYEVAGSEIKSLKLFSE